MQLRGFKRAYVHFKAGGWNGQNPEASAALEAMKAGVEVQITYDDPWFWKIGISRSLRPSEAPKPKPKPLVTIGTAVGVPGDGKGLRVPLRSLGLVGGVVCGEKSGVEDGEVSE